MTPWSMLGSVHITDGSWLDLPEAAAYAGVPLAGITRAINRGDLDPDMTRGHSPTLVLYSRDVEAWAAAREGASATAPLAAALH